MRTLPKRRRDPDGLPLLRGLVVVVAGINFAPEHAGIGPYTTAACEHLHSIGAQVSVITGLPHYPSWTLPRSYSRRLHVDEDYLGIPVRRLRHHVPSRSNAFSRMAYELTFGANMVTQLHTKRPDVILAVIPSLAGSAAVSMLAASQGVPVVLWIQDLMGPAVKQSGIKGGGLLLGATERLERAVLKRAAGAIVINDAFARYVEDRGVQSSRINLIRNWSHVEAPTCDRQAMRQDLGWGPRETIVLHSGNMGFKQGLESVITAGELADRENLPVRFVLMGDGSQRGALQRKAAGLDTVTFLQPVKEADFTNVLSAADILLVNERASVIDMSLPSKLTSYFRSGRPIVASVPRGGATHLEVERSGAGIVAPPDDAESLLKAIQQLQADPTRGRLGVAGQRYATEHLDARHALDALTQVLLSAARTPS